VTFGAGVVDRLVDLIAAGPGLVADRYPAKAEAFTVILGCVPWLTAFRVADALMAAGSHCICVDKSALGSQRYGDCWRTTKGWRTTSSPTSG
jgi:hypothetical protein